MRHAFQLFASLVIANALYINSGCTTTFEPVDNDGADSPSITELAAQKASLETFTDLVQQANLTDTLSAGGPFTVFAPTDAAFAKVDPAVLDAIVADGQLAAVLKYHVVPGTLTAADVIGMTSVTTITGDTLDVVIVGNQVTVGGAVVTDTDNLAGNGVIHGIASVLLPPSDQPLERTQKNIVETAAGNGQFDTLLAAATAAGLADTLANDGPFTVFAPTDAAFQALPEGALDALLAEPTALADVLLYHVVAGDLKAEQVVAATSLPTLQGADIEIVANESGVFINDAQVMITDIACTNGTIHVIDAVLSVPEPTVPGPQPAQSIIDVAQNAGGFDTLLSAVDIAGLTDTLKGDGPFTVFAPTDAAFNALPSAVLGALLNDPAALADVLLYHVVGSQLSSDVILATNSLNTLQGTSISITTGGGKLAVNGATVIITDIVADNGVIHVIDAVLVPEADKEIEPVDPPTQPPAGVGTIVEEAQGNDHLGTLLTAVSAAGLTETLQGEGPFTLFAPTDSAFNALPQGALAGLLENPEALTDVLLYHVAEGALTSDTLSDLEAVDTIQGEAAPIGAVGSVLTIDGAPVTVADIECSNGVIHVINAVLLPPPPGTIAEEAAEAGNFTTLLAAATAAGLAGTLHDPNADLTVFAPTDDAFAALPEGVLESLLANPDALADILLYHVLDGTKKSDEVLAASLLGTLQGSDVKITVENGAAYVNDAQIIVTDIKANNGVIHVIDAVLTPPGTIGQTLLAHPQLFSTLVTATQVAGLYAALDAPGQLTVFAPTNDAFAALPEGVLKDLFADPVALGNILGYHAVVGKFAAADVLEAGALTTLTEQDIEFSVVGGDVFVNGAQIVTTDIPTSNGVIHVIDAVLIP